MGSLKTFVLVKPWEGWINVIFDEETEQYSSKYSKSAEPGGNCVEAVPLNSSQSPNGLIIWKYPTYFPLFAWC